MQTTRKEGELFELLQGWSKICFISHHQNYCNHVIILDG